MEYDVYEEAGYANREDYFISLAEDFDVSLNCVRYLSDILGQEEDFDMLITSLEDYTHGL